MKIESLQDTSRYHSKDQSLGGSVTAGAGFSASANVGQQKMKSEFASVMEQSGIKAGDGGFQLDVKGGTSLIGGAGWRSQRGAELIDGLARNLLVLLMIDYEAHALHR